MYPTFYSRVCIPQGLFHSLLLVLITGDDEEGVREAVEVGKGERSDSFILGKCY
jgi:hypothetical protein